MGSTAYRPRSRSKSSVTGDNSQVASALDEWTTVSVLQRFDKPLVSIVLLHRAEKLNIIQDFDRNHHYHLSNMSKN